MLIFNWPKTKLANLGVNMQSACALAISAIMLILPSAPFAGDVLIDNETCLECHEDPAVAMRHTVHQLTPPDGSGGAIAIGCVSCHAGADAHLDDPDVSTIENPANLSMEAEATVCAACHLNDHQVSMVETNPHELAGLNCSACHAIHAAGEQPRRSSETCLTCHDDQKGEFALSSNHRVLEGVVECIDCHDIAQKLQVPFGDILTRRCFSCHGELEGPYPFEHQATNAYSVEGGGCLECHRPHGSIFDRLLREPGTQLCRQCHAAPIHQTAHNGLFANENCLNCHADIHGSFDDEHYFPPGVPPATCSQSGCHPLGGN